MSRLSSKIKICEYLDSISEEQTLEVLKWMKEELQCTSINQFLIKMLIDSKDLFSDDGLKSIANKINLSMVSNNKNNSNTNNNTLNNNPSNTSTTNHTRDPNLNEQKINHFPLLKLPKDTICKIGLILNKEDLLDFECCNRMLYTIVNCASFLNQCRYFKKLQFTDKFLDAIIEKKSNCCKFMFANELIFDFNFYSCEKYDVCFDRIDEIRNKFKKVFWNDDGHSSDWSILLLRSIEKIYFRGSGMIIVDLMDVDILFDKDKSQLKEIRFLEDGDLDSEGMESFIKNYSKKQDPKMLNILRTNETLMGNKIECLVFTASHLMLDVNSEFDHCTLGMLEGLSQLTKLTLNYRDEDAGHLLPIRGNINGMNIDTLRLTANNLPWKNLLTHEKLVQKMNFDKKLKRLTMNVRLANGEYIKLGDITNEITSVITSVIKKDYLFNLEHVNILFELRHHHDNVTRKMGWQLLTVIEVLDILFDILNANINRLKHQFKQLNFGIKGCWCQQKN